MHQYETNKMSFYMECHIANHYVIVDKSGKTLSGAKINNRKSVSRKCSLF